MRAALGAADRGNQSRRCGESLLRRPERHLGVCAAEKQMRQL